MKRTYSFYTLIGGDLGTAIGIVLENIPAGLSFGIALGIIVAIMLEK